MNVSVVGSGRQAHYHSKALSSIPGIVLHTVIDPDEEYARRLQNKVGFAHVAYSLDAALNKAETDVVVVCTPNPLHAPQTRAALLAGKHVLCEVPLAMSYAEAERLVRLAEEHERRLMVCHTQYFERGRIELRRMIAEGEFVPLRLLSRFFMFRRGNLTTRHARQGWVDNMLWHHGSHVIDTIMDVVGAHEAQDLHVQWGPAWPGIGLPLDVDLQWHATSPITGREVLVNVALSHNAQWGTNHCHVVGLDQDVRVEHGHLWTKDGDLVQPDDGYERIRRQDNEFVAAIREGRRAALEAPVALPTLRIIQDAWDVWCSGEGAT